MFLYSYSKSLPYHLYLSLKFSSFYYSLFFLPLVSSSPRNIIQEWAQGPLTFHSWKHLLCSRASITNYYKLGGKTQQKCILLKFWKPQDIKLLAELHFLWRLYGRILPCFQFLGLPVFLDLRQHNSSPYLWSLHGLSLFVSVWHFLLCLLYRYFSLDLGPILNPGWSYLEILNHIYEGPISDGLIHRDQR